MIIGIEGSAFFQYLDFFCRKKKWNSFEQEEEMRFEFLYFSIYIEIKLIFKIISHSFIRYWFMRIIKFESYYFSLLYSISFSEKSWFQLLGLSAQELNKHKYITKSA